MSERDLEFVKACLSRNIKRLRAESNLAQERLALEAGVDRTVVSKIERMVSNPSLEVLVKLAAALKVSVAALLMERVVQ
jgi:transcriptional regulator with XRE-family HTH domain